MGDHDWFWRPLILTSSLIIWQYMQGFGRNMQISLRGRSWCYLLLWSTILRRWGSRDFSFKLFFWRIDYASLATNFLSVYTFRSLKICCKLGLRDSMILRIVSHWCLADNPNRDRCKASFSFSLVLSCLFWKLRGHCWLEMLVNLSIFHLLKYLLISSLWSSVFITISPYLRQS